MKKPHNINPTKPGEMLELEFLIPMKMTQSALAAKLGCAPRVVNEICRNKRGISAVMAYRLSEVFKNSPEFWLNMQMANDLWDAWLFLQAERKAG
jgi:antitoxin HigA-1